MYFIFGIQGGDEQDDSSKLRGVFFDQPEYTPSIIIDRSFEDSRVITSELRKTFQEINGRYDASVTLIGLEPMDVMAFRLWWSHQGEKNSDFKLEYNIYQLSSLLGLKANSSEKTLDNIFQIVKKLKGIHNFLATQRTH